jgi:Transposase DDE domain group 1
MQTKTPTPSTKKVRRDSLGGKRGDGHRRFCRIRRADTRNIQLGRPDAGLTGYGGLAGFGTFVRDLGVDKALREQFRHLKSSRMVVYPMEAQMRLLIDAAVAGEHRVFGVEALSADPLFVHLAGGVVPSLDTIYRDLRRFDGPTLVALEEMMAAHGLAPVRAKRRALVNMDVDTTVEPLFGEHEGALVGPNPRYHGRPSYHPIVARCAETDTVVGAKLRPGDTSFGDADAPTVGAWIDRLREATGPDTVIRVRIDSAGDCTRLMSTINRKKAHFLVKAKTSADLCTAMYRVPPGGWETVDVDADGKPTRQVAEVNFARGEWLARGLEVRVIVVRSKERDTGKQLYLWGDTEWTAQAFLTNDFHGDADDLAHQYDGRAGVEPLIAELKGSWGIGKVPSESFVANHAALLLKLLTLNLLRRYVIAIAPALALWRAPWIRRALIVVPGRFGRHGRRPRLRLAPRPHLRN